MDIEIAFFKLVKVAHGTKTFDIFITAIKLAALTQRSKPESGPVNLIFVFED